MPTYFLISLILIVLCILTFIYHGMKKLDLTETVGGIISIFVLALTLMVGIGIVPVIQSHTTTYTELIKPEIIKSEHVIVVDALNQLPTPSYFNVIVKFDNHQFVETYNDSVKFFLKQSFSYYHAIVDEQMVYSKPPYNKYFSE